MGHRRLDDQPLKQPALAASEIDNPSCPNVPHSLKHRFESLFAQTDRQFGRLLGCVVLCVDEVSVLAGVGETRQSLPGEFGKTQVPASDQIGFGMRPKPVAAPQRSLSTSSGPIQ